MNASAQPIRPGSDPKEIVALLKRLVLTDVCERQSGFVFKACEAIDKPSALGRFDEGHHQGRCQRATWTCGVPKNSCHLHF